MTDSRIISSAHRRKRRWLNASLLIAVPAGACTPEPTRSVALPASPAPAALAETRELVAALDAASEVASGSAVTEQGGGVVLSLGSATLLHLTGSGSPCTLDEGAKLLALFDGPEAFSLVGDRTPSIVARERDSGRLRCWPIVSPARVEPYDFTPTAAQVEVAREPESGYEDEDATTRQTMTAELRPELEGAETMELELLEVAAHLRVTSHAGALLLDWEAGEPCERHEASVTALRREAGVVFVLDQRCDACPACDHGDDRLDRTDEIWWPDSGSPFVTESRSLHDTAGGSMNSGQRSSESQTRASWGLNEGVLHHEIVESETTYTSYECEDEDENDCCVRRTVDTARSATWIYEPSSGAPLEWVVDQASATSEGECE